MMQKNCSNVNLCSLIGKQRCNLVRFKTILSVPLYLSCSMRALFSSKVYHAPLSVSDTATLSGMLKPLPVYRTTLNNGLRVVVIPKHSAPVVSVCVAYHVGSYDEYTTATGGNYGFAHLFEHLMFEGSENVAHGMFDRYCSTAGGENNAYTTFDKTMYYMTLPAHQVELGLWLESDRMGGFAIGEDSLTAQKNVVLEEINQNVENQPYGKFGHIFNRLAFAPECGYGHDVYGDTNHIAQSTLDDVRTFYRTFYRPDNAVLLIVGDIQPDKGFALADQYFGHIVNADIVKPHKEFHTTFRLGNRYQCVEDTIPTPTLFTSFHFDGFTQSDYMTAEIIASILSDGMSSRLYKSLVYDQQIAAETNMWVDDRFHTSLVTLYSIAAVPDTSCDMLYASTMQVLRELASAGIDERELTKAKNRMMTRIAKSYQRVSGIADEAAHQALFFDDPARMFSLMDGFLAVTADDIQTFAQKVFVENNQVRIDFIPLQQPLTA